MKNKQNIEELVKKSYLNNLRVPTGPDIDERILDDAVARMEKSRTAGSASAGLNIRRIIMRSRMTKLAAVAVIAIALLGPLSYGTAHLIKRFITGPVGADTHKGEFELGKDIYVELGIGTEEVQRIVSARNVRFFFEDGQLNGTLRCDVRCRPEFKWRTKVELLNDRDKRLAYTEHVAENGGVAVHEYAPSFRRDIHFSLGPWSDVARAHAFKVRLERVSEKTEITPEAWLETNELDIVRGRVVGPGGKPIANAHIQIREKRKPGQNGIAAPDVCTDKRGYYSFDGIKWPYRVSVLVYETLPSGQGYRHQFKRLNKVLEGSQKVDFELDKFPTGSAILSGSAERPNGETIAEFTVDVRSKVDWDDYSTDYLYQFGCRRKFASSDGKFEIDDLSAGVYDISVLPEKSEVVGVDAYLERRSYMRELRNGQITDISTEDAEEKVWYGRVLFEDGSPAVPDLPGLKTQIVVWGLESSWGLTVATVDENGYFTALAPDKGMEQLKSGKALLFASIAKANLHHKVQKGERFPVELLSSQRDKAGVLRIARPKVYYGRVLYGNGKPAVPETAPWPGARVYAVMRYSPATSRTGGITEDLADVDKQGYFAVLLTDRELKQIKDGELKIQIYHPSYEEERVSYIIGTIPATMLSADRNNVKSYKFPYDEMSSEFRNLERQLESVERLKELDSALSTYSRNNAGRFPQRLEDLNAPELEELLAWAKEHIEYLTNASTAPAHERADSAIAYDKALLEKANGTNVLFYDGHAEFCRPKKLQALGISK